ncbi:unnamed protein product [Tetraodon nigroviridis]|uniref:Sulfotransferase n=1 Tax=Tetraodon nigroviridis TaxID=99883 RepID=Q4RNI5_TETNG|nr:unnamed protein product [Tetraodon nigroviridis]
METLDMITSDIFRYKGMNFLIKDKLRPKDIDALQDFEIRPSDVFIITFPKSGTVWMQQILSQVMEESHPGWAKDVTNRAQIPYLEGRTADDPFRERKDPRVIRTHLFPELLPRGVKDKQIKVLYVLRNPKDALVSLYHFAHSWVLMDSPRSFEEFFKQFMEGKRVAGDWKNHLTVAQNEYFDQVFREEMSHFPLIGDMESFLEYLGESEPICTPLTGTTVLCRLREDGPGLQQPGHTQPGLTTLTDRLPTGHMLTESVPKWLQPPFTDHMFKVSSSSPCMTQRPPDRPGQGVGLRGQTCHSDAPQGPSPPGRVSLPGQAWCQPASWSQARRPSVISASASAPAPTGRRPDTCMYMYQHKSWIFGALRSVERVMGPPGAVSGLDPGLLPGCQRPGVLETSVSWRCPHSCPPHSRPQTRCLSAQKGRPAVMGACDITLADQTPWQPDNNAADSATTVQEARKASSLRKGMWRVDGNVSRLCSQ